MFDLLGPLADVIAVTSQLVVGGELIDESLQANKGADLKIKPANIPNFASQNIFFSHLFQIVVGHPHQPSQRNENLTFAVNKIYIYKLTVFM